MIVYKTSKYSPEQELEFKLNYQLSLTTAERFQMMFQKITRAIAAMVLKKDTKSLLKLLKENNVLAFQVLGYARATLDINLFIDILSYFS